jgi:8-oxo-dGTP diphosphatase
MEPWLTVGAHALVFDRAQRLLLTRRADREQWRPPGGAVEPGEAAIRETREETGYVVSVDSLVGLYYHRDRTDLICVFRC